MERHGAGLLRRDHVGSFHRRTHPARFRTNLSMGMGGLGCDGGSPFPQRAGSGHPAPAQHHGPGSRGTQGECHPEPCPPLRDGDRPAQAPRGHGRRSKHVQRRGSNRLVRLFRHRLAKHPGRYGDHRSPARRGCLHTAHFPDLHSHRRVGDCRSAARLWIGNCL